jgi:hypothetical protein
MNDESNQKQLTCISSLADTSDYDYSDAEERSRHLELQQFVYRRDQHHRFNSKPGRYHATGKLADLERSRVGLVGAQDWFNSGRPSIR